MYLLINDEYGQEIAAVQYDEEKEKLKDVFDAARVKYPYNAFCVSSSSATMPEPAAPVTTVSTSSGMSTDTFFRL